MRKTVFFALLLPSLLWASFFEHHSKKKGNPPAKVKALYINFHAANPQSITFKKILHIIDTTEINAVVVDIKNVKGDISYRSTVPEAKKIGAGNHATIPDIHSYIRNLKSRGVYTIARIAVFKDTRQALHFPGRAVKTSGGAVWKDKHNTAWVDPFRRESQDYTLSIAEEAAKSGFDEINFDYIRFPARYGLRYAKANTQANRIAAIESFLRRARERLHPLGTAISVDIFGYVAWNKTDTHIGQTVTSLAKYADYICPMLYPSGFHAGTLGYHNPAQHPYPIVKTSILKAHQYVEPHRIRPWLQSFRDYAFDHVSYREQQIALQIQAADDTHTNGWFLWNPSSHYPYVNSTLFSMTRYHGKVKPSAKRAKAAKHKEGDKAGKSHRPNMKNLEFGIF